MEQKRKKIEELKKKKNAVIMAHYYVEDDVQMLADYIGDSYYLSDMATKIDADVIVLCGVEFMGESAKILNPDKMVLLPAADADCPMAHMASIAKIEEVRREYDDVAVVCYVNSTAQLKAKCDVCVTSANALKVIKALPNKNVFMIPDQNLAHYVADQLPEKHFIYNEGYCHMHHGITVDNILDAKAKWPEAKVLVHPECKPEVTALADYIGSTSGIINFVGQCDDKEYIVVTEKGVMYELKSRNPEKIFHTVIDNQVCENMKKVTVDKIIDVLENESSQVILSDELMKEAYAPMVRMLELSR